MQKYNHLPMLPPYYSSTVPVQIGGSNPFHSDQSYFIGTRRQRGAGIGAIFGVLARKLLPFAQKYIAPHAKTAFKNVLNDAIEGGNIKQSLKKHSVDALKSVGRAYVNQTGSGRRRKRVAKRGKAKFSKRSKNVANKSTAASKLRKKARAVKKKQSNSANAAKFRYLEAKKSVFD